MLKKRIIPCLDVRDGRVVKGINFENIRDAGEAVSLGKRYADEGADELVFLDITATNEKRKTLKELVSSVAAAINIPFTVGGGINSVEDAKNVIESGADKVSINTAAVNNPALITELKDAFGSQCVVVAIDTKCHDGVWMVHTHGGKVGTDLKCVDWAKKAEALGAGEILLTSMDEDGTKKGFSLDITGQVSQAVSIPVIASGGAGNMEHFQEVFTQTEATGGLAASIFHYGQIGIRDLKNYLNTTGIPVRKF
jgi:imidazole glycerol-phosphate synthase subunit HisF